MRKYLLLLILVGIGYLFCQNNLSKIDSLETALSNSNSSERLLVISKLIQEYLSIDPYKSIDYGNEALRLAEKLNNKKMKAQILSDVGIAYEYIGNYTKALANYNQSLDIANSLENEEIVGNALINIAVVNQNLHRYSESLNYNIQALDLYQKLGNQRGVASTLNNIGNVYLYMEQYDKALKYYLESVEIKLSLESPINLATTYQNIALVYQSQNNLEQAIYYFDIALKELQEKGDRQNLAITYENLSRLYHQAGDYNKALFFIYESQHLYEDMKNTVGLCSSNIHLVNVLIKLGKMKEAYEKIEESYQLAADNNLKDLFPDIFQVKSLYYETIGKYDLALRNYKKFKALSDSLENETRNQQLAELNIQFETAQKEKELELLKQKSYHDKQIRNFLIYIIIFGIIIIAILINLYYGKIKDNRIKQEIQERLQQSESKYRLLTDNLNVAVFTFNTSGKFTYVNKATTKLTGYTASELLNMNFYDFVHPLQRDEVSRRGLAKIRGEEIPPGYLHRIVTKSGEIRWFDSSSIRITLGGELMVLGTSIDVTDQIVAHQKLTASEAQLRALFTAMDDLIFILDKKGTYVFIAPTNPELMYRPVKEIEGKLVSEVVPAEVADLFLKKIQECLEKQDVVLFEYQLVINNETLWFDGRLSPLNEDSVLFVGRDITAAKESVEKLVESEEKYRNLVESIEEGMAIVDADQKFIFVNNAATRIYGYTKEELIGMDVKKILTPEGEKVLLEQYELRRKGEVTKYENWNIRKNGEKILLKISSSPMFVDGEFAGSISIFSDITEIRKAEEEIKKSLREKEVMLQEIYHRVKNNMQIISSMLKLQSMHLTKENALEVFRNSQNRVKSMSLVHEKLYRSKDLSRINARDYFSSLFKQLFISYSEKAKNIKYSIECDDVDLNIDTAIPCGLIANELLTNSFKHAFDNSGGKIFLRFKKIANDYLQLEIGDDGKHFPADFDLEHAESFGLQLVDILSKQLHADFRLKRENGLCFVFRFSEIRK